ncbi:hypothetical protein PAPYR_73 [Paratrimastix pyriformis]|uniref:Uncharacterized protein n=1 Tax=Paratrimastix pyriformis TaxID=342808 RepID=A0ABQ8UUS9_9EUKA|nr:hypothetical protein PAPYR_73 [Paratrimastix pyriformis]
MTESLPPLSSLLKHLETEASVMQLTKDKLTEQLQKLQREEAQLVRKLELLGTATQQPSSAPENPVPAPDAVKPQAPLSQDGSQTT